MILTQMFNYFYGVLFASRDSDLRVIPLPGTQIKEARF